MIHQTTVNKVNGFSKKVDFNIFDLSERINPKVSLQFNVNNMELERFIRVVIYNKSDICITTENRQIVNTSGLFSHDIKDEFDSKPITYISSRVPASSPKDFILIKRYSTTFMMVSQVRFNLNNTPLHETETLLKRIRNTSKPKIFSYR